MSYPQHAQNRPGVLGPVTAASFILSVLNVIWVGLIGVVALLAGGASWLGGPIVGLAVSTIAAIVMLYVLVQSILSVLLFVAAWKTWKGEPGGRTLHVLWAWIILFVDAIDLLLTGGLEPSAWFRLIYAAIILWVMSRDDVRAYFGQANVSYQGAGKPPRLNDL